MPEETRAALLQALYAERPDLAGKTVGSPGSGKNGHVFLFDDEVFKASADKEQIPFIEQERRILRHLNTKNLPVPRVTCTGKNAAFFGMTRLPGEILTRPVFDSLSNDEKTAFAYKISGFAAGLAGSFTELEARELVRLKGPFSVTEDSVAAALNDPKLRDCLRDRLPAIEATIDRYKATRRTARQIVAHDDLHMGNILIDPATTAFQGVIDFSYVNIGIPEESLWFWLKPFSPETRKAVCRDYPAPEGRHIDYKTVVACDLGDNLRQLAGLLEKGDTAGITRFTQRIDKKLEEMGE